jgi:DNA-binding XRE family transcriptional regulator
MFSRSGKIVLTMPPATTIFPIGKMMNRRDDMGAEYARWLGSMIRARREALGLRLDDLAAATGVGRRFLHELEKGKPSCQLGRALAVAAAVGIRPSELFEEDSGAAGDDLPPLTAR